MRTFTIRIPEPCHENWESMKPETKGRFCSSCEKVVVDFTGKTNQEIHDILTESTDKKVCGHFRKNQVGHPLVIHLDTQVIGSSAQPRKMFIAALLLVFGTSLFSCYDHQDKKIMIGEVKIHPPSERTTGLVLSEMDMIATPENEDVMGKTKLTGEVLATDECSRDGVLIARDSVDQTTRVRGDTTIEEQIFREEYITGGMRYDPSEHDIRNTILNHGIDSAQTLTDVLVADTLDTKTIESIGFTVYPNPGSGQFFVKYTVTEKGPVVVDLFDLQGKKRMSVVDIKEQHTGEYHIPVDLSPFSPDIYVVRLLLNGKPLSSRIVLQK